MPKAAVKLRGHHLLCMLSYRGEGYTPAFIENFDAIINQINNGAAIEIVSGADDICAALRQGGDTSCAHAKVCRKESVKTHDRVALKDVARALKKRSLQAGNMLKISKGDIRHLRHLFVRGAIRAACTTCPWRDFCSQIAAEKFSGVKLLPPTES